MAPAGACILGCAGPVLSAREAAFFARAQPFGFILFARNVVSPAQLAALTASLRAAVGRDAPVLVDQEGGRVARLAPPAWRGWPPPLDHARAAGAGAARAFYLRYRLIADDLRAVGIDANCAPLADIARDTTHAFLRNRCYGVDAKQVSAIGRAVADGLRDGGVLPVLKHLPGHGRARSDSHAELPIIAEPLADLHDDFVPFAALSDLPMGMTAHLRLTAVDDRPATLSPKVIGLIRDRIGFDGLLMTDDISMGALDGRLRDRVQGALAAGCDLVLHCNGDLDEMKTVADSAGMLDAGAARRAARALAQRAEPRPFDRGAAEKELRALEPEGSHA